MENIDLVISEKWQRPSEVLNYVLFENEEISPIVLHKIFSTPTLLTRLREDIKTYNQLISFLEEVKNELHLKSKDSFNEYNSSSDLMRKGFRAFWFWMESGLKIVEEERFERRIAICQTCPYYDTNPSKTIYKISNQLLGKSPVCTKCGCTLNNKARSASNTCPVENPNQPGFTMWGDLVSDKSSY